MNLYHYHKKEQFKKRTQLSDKRLEPQHKKLFKYLSAIAKKIPFYRRYKNLPYAAWPVLDWNIVSEKKAEFVKHGFWRSPQQFIFESSNAESKFLAGHPCLKKKKNQAWYLSREAIFATVCEHGNIQFEKDLYYIEPAWTDERQDHMVPLVSTLTREENPLVRYRVDEFLLQKHEVCCCNKSSGCSYRVVGQAEDILYVPHLFEKKLLPLYPEKIDFLMKQFPSIHNYQIVQQSTEMWKLRLETKCLYSLTIDLPNKLQSYLLSMQMRCPKVTLEKMVGKSQKQDKKIIKAFI
tara:strand:- start:29869 stop:30747 length:879 start_codon:yes stop_codon:yes gene_type:complete